MSCDFITLVPSLRDSALVCSLPSEESYLSKKGDDPRTDQVDWQPKEKEA